MARPKGDKPKSKRKPASESVKAAADRAEARARGEAIDTPKVPIDPPIERSGIADPATSPPPVWVPDVAPPLPPKSARGRPSVFSLDMAAEICVRITSRDIAGNPRNLRHVCMDPDIPHEGTIYRWLASDGPEFDKFREMYARARETRADMLAEDNLVIADVETDAARARVRIDARKWYAAKINPRRYGEKVELDTAPGGGLAQAMATTMGALAALAERKP